MDKDPIVPEALTGPFKVISFPVKLTDPIALKLPTDIELLPESRVKVCRFDAVTFCKEIADPAESAAIVLIVLEPVNVICGAMVIPPPPLLLTKMELAISTCDVDSDPWIVKAPSGWSPSPRMPLRVIRFPTPKLVALIVNVSALDPKDVAPIASNVMAAPEAIPPFVESIVASAVKRVGASTVIEAD
jgi:hypothetical protein